MRALPFLAGTVFALGLAFGAPANAHNSHTRIWVSFGDVVFSAGMPYHRLHHHPLAVEHGRRGPRYYYYAPRAQHWGPAHGYAPGYYYYEHTYYAPTPPPRRRGYYRHRPGY